MRPLVAAALAVVLHAACTAGTAETTLSPTTSPTDTPIPSAPASPGAATPVPNLQAGVVSEDGLFVASWQSDPERPPINAVHAWVLHIETAGGEPAAGALVTVDGDMPAHGHGMPTRPQVTADLGGGDYLVEGMAFQMGGYWIVDLTVTFEGQTDLVRFGLEL